MESFINSDEEQKDFLPSGSRETTPQNDAIDLTDYIDDKGFFWGNPHVEVTKGIIHIYKKK